MLREVADAGWLPVGVWPLRRYVYVAGRRRAARSIGRGRLARAAAEQRASAVAVLEDGESRHWWCLDRFYAERQGLAAQDVFALAHERRLRAERQLERARSVLASTVAEPVAQRRTAPLAMRRAVWERDCGRCVSCGSRFELQFDHVIPVALGGATSVENLQVLCGGCNRAKGASLG